MKRFLIYTMALPVFAALLVLGGCNDWLNVKPANEQPLDEFWQTKEEVDAVVMGAYTKMRLALNRFVWWGELRGDAVDLGAAVGEQSDLLAVKALEIRSDNSVCAWVDLYSVIGRCNSVILSAPSVRQRDNTFTPEACDAYVAEAKWIRALAYFYLVRAFRDVPYVSEPFLTDDIEFRVPKSDGYTILATLAAELENVEQDIAIAFKAGSWENKGRATVWSLYALLADIYLWLGEYDKTIDMCDRIETAGLFSLGDYGEWYGNFYPGNSEESIFELQWSYDHQQTNNLFTWFYGGSGNPTYIPSASLIAKFETGADVRGYDGSFSSLDRIWKYGGTAFFNSTEPPVHEWHDNNWIVYRLAEIILMRAEALIMKGPAYYNQAYQQIMRLRERAACLLQIPQPADESAMLDLLLDEKVRELAFEGKRWFDLVRVATRNDGQYRDKLIDVLLVNVAPSDRPVYKAKLQNSYGYYFPISERDIIASGGILVQNPYYL